MSPGVAHVVRTLGEGPLFLDMEILLATDSPLDVSTFKKFQDFDSTGHTHKIKARGL
jgi:hypothetical protein